MKKICSLILICCAFSVLSFGQLQPISKANYQAAARYSPSQIQKMVHSTSVNPHWLKESNRFWYTYETSDGIAYYLVDLDRKQKQALFDNVKMAADMSRLTGDPFDAQHLYISKLRFIKNETVLQFEVKSKLAWEEEKEEEDQEDGDSQEKKKKKESRKEEKRTQNLAFRVRPPNTKTATAR